MNLIYSKFQDLAYFIRIMSEKPKIYFLGSGYLALPTLSTLLDSEKIQLVGIGTQLDHPSGRGRHLTPTPVGQFLEKKALKLDKIPSVNAPEFITKIKGLAPDFIVTASFGQILKEEILNLPKYGCINIHASILPAYRGAAPIHYAILNGEKKTGVSIMKMERGLDTGPIYQIFEMEIDETIKTPELEEKLGILAAQNIENVLLQIYDGSLQPQPQPLAGISYAKKIHKDDGRINWNIPASKICRMLRAFYPWPGAFFELEISEGHLIHIKITEMTEDEPLHLPPGTIVADQKKFRVACGNDTAISIEKLIPEGRKEMKIADFLHGLHAQELKIKDIIPNHS